MKAYREYKKWWIQFQALSLVPSLYWGETEEDAFKQHIADMGLYKLMETLADWDEE